MSLWSDYGTFWKVSRNSFKTTGSVMPSSPFLAKALTTALDGPREAAHILEVGPGTGVVTKAIAREMRPADRLDCVELNPQFSDHVRRLVETDAVFNVSRDRIRVIETGVEKLEGENVYDFIISGLPFNSFSSELVQTVFDAFSRLLKPGGVLSYFEYEFVRHLQRPFVSRDSRARLHGVGQVVTKYISAYQKRYQRVFINVPPAIVRHLHLKPAGSPTANSR